MDTALHSFVGHLLRGPEPHTEQEDKDPKSGSSHGCPSEKFSGSAGLLQVSKPGLLRGRAACTGLILAVWSLLWGQVCPPPSPGSPGQSSVSHAVEAHFIPSPSPKPMLGPRRRGGPRVVWTFGVSGPTGAHLLSTTHFSFLSCHFQLFPERTKKLECQRGEH